MAIEPPSLLRSAFMRAGTSDRQLLGSIADLLSPLSPSQLVESWLLPACYYLIVGGVACDGRRGDFSSPTLATVRESGFIFV